MLLLIFVLFIFIFIALPYDVQLWLLGLIMTVPPSFWFGMLGASFASMFWYAQGWNGLATRLHHEETAQANDKLRQRRR